MESEAVMFDMDPTLSEEEINRRAEEVTREWMLLFKYLRSNDQKSFEEINGLSWRQRHSVHNTLANFTLKTRGFPEVMLISLAYSVHGTTFSDEFFDFYRQVVGLRGNCIVMADLETIVETLGKPEFLGREPLLQVLEYYGIRPPALDFLVVGEPQILNRETLCELFRVFKGKKTHCDLFLILPLMLALFIEYEVTLILKHRMQALCILGASDDVLGPKQVLLDDVLPFLPPSISAEETTERPRLNSSLLQATTVVLMRDLETNEKVLTFRHIQSILSVFQMSGFSTDVPHDTIMAICNDFRSLMGVDQASSIETRKLSLNSALPTLAQMICARKALTALKGAPKSKLKYEDLRWHIAVYGLRLTKEGITRYLAEELNLQGEVNFSQLETGLTTLLKYALPLASTTKMLQVPEQLANKVRDFKPADIAEFIFESMLEQSWELLRSNVGAIISPKTYYKHSQSEVGTVKSLTTNYIVRESPMDDLLKEVIQNKQIEFWFERYGIDRTNTSKTASNLAIKKIIADRERKKNPVLSTAPVITEQPQDIEDEHRRIQELQLNANRIILRAQANLEARKQEEDRLVSSAFPNSDCVPMSALKNILRKEDLSSRYLKHLSDRVNASNEEMSFFEFSKTAAILRVDMDKQTGWSKESSQLKQLIQKTGTQVQSETPTREPPKLESVPFKVMVSLPPRNVKASDGSVCTCCELY
jgi:hypothetical protein